MDKEDLLKKIIGIIPDRFSVVLMSVILLSSLWNLFFLNGSFNPDSFFFGFSAGLTIPAFILYFRKRKILKEHESYSKG